MRPAPGDLVGGKYRIVRMIGDGGMGTVYEARHEGLGTTVALKFLHSELARRPGLAARFQQEARVSASIQSPHVTHVVDVDQAPDGTAYLVMELLGGESLQALLDRSRKLPLDTAVDYALQMLLGLEAAHALGVVHRDLKPDNVFVTPSTGGPLIKLLDFGIAKLRQTSEYQKGLTRPGAIMGTPEYMAPEQAYSADRVDHRADLYSLGAMLFEMLCGERPVYGDDAHDIASKIASGQVKKLAELAPSLPRDLCDVVQRALAADPARRWQSALDFRLALSVHAGALSHAGKLAATPPPGTAAPLTAAPSAVPQPGRVEATTRRDVPAGPAVPKTLPPGDGPSGTAPSNTDAALPPSAKGYTQDGAQIGASAAAVTPPGAAPWQQGPQPGHAPQLAAAHYAAYTPPRRSQPRSLAAIGALLLGALLTAAIVAVVVLRRSGGDTPDPTPIETAAPSTTITAQTTAETPAPTSTPGPTPVPTQIGTKPGRRTDAGVAVHADAGSVAARDAGSTPGFPLPFGSALPIPSGLPFPIPTQFPKGWTLPTFPGGQTPPANSGK